MGFWSYLCGVRPRSSPTSAVRRARQWDPAWVHTPFHFPSSRSSAFENAFGKPAYKVHDKTFVYIEGNAPDEAVTVAVSATERKIAVTVIAGGDWGVNYIREFFEAPFFLRSESERLYTLLDANPSAGAAALDRFDVKIDVFKTREWIVIGTEFEPPGSYLYKIEENGLLL